jgi:hypothetical protein
VRPYNTWYGGEAATENGRRPGTGWTQETTRVTLIARGDLGMTQTGRNSLVRLDGVSPKYLKGLRGEVVEIKGGRCDVKLDERSVTSLRFTRYAHVGVDGVLRGVPKSACVVEGPLNNGGEPG